MMALECGWLIIVRRKDKIQLNTNSSFKMDSKPALGVRVVQFGREMILFRGSGEVLTNTCRIRGLQEGYNPDNECEVEEVRGNVPVPIAAREVNGIGVI
jgi:imidazole glycerol phosphate synthase subunit HisF